MVIPVLPSWVLHEEDTNGSFLKAVAPVVYLTSLTWALMPS